MAGGGGAGGWGVMGLRARRMLEPVMKARMIAVWRSCSCVSSAVVYACARECLRDM